MENEVVKVPIVRLTEEGSTDIEDIVAREFPLTIMVNNQELVTLLCSPADLKYLAVGYLFSEGLLDSKEEFKGVIIDEQRGIARVSTADEADLNPDIFYKRLITSGCGRGSSFYNAADVSGEKVETDLKVSTGQILSLVKEFQHRSEIYRSTGGVHSAALCHENEILLFSEDIGRHNALDKIFGECFLNDIPTDERIIVSSGRISSEMLLKVAKRNVPVIVSKSAPTDMGIKLANDLGITLIGFVRGKRMNAYTNSHRIKS
ncbi:formate dehydrogenase accessory sulfurtransferase FdhD [Chloroflexota bacterium]